MGMRIGDGDCGEAVKGLCVISTTAPRRLEAQAYRKPTYTHSSQPASILIGMMSRREPRQLISGYHKACDDLLESLILCNYHDNAPSVESLRPDLYDRVFASGWSTYKAVPEVGGLTKRKVEDTGLYLGTLNRDVATTAKGKGVPGHRRAGQQAMFKASFEYSGQLNFYWVDTSGQKLPTDAVDVEGDLTEEELEEMVGSHYDSSEVARVGGWNWSKVVGWARTRLVSLSQQGTVSTTVLQEENVSELVKVRTIAEYKDRVEAASEM
ncbi:hypothetical protein Cob_v011525 [Colletotrichum orbiculare MAFF 240422]|uniref:Uncharacterized protein n=1 Tax=Colletotrichum orbiculare (strain 104-T / ATCC 96160 / CBS 514.97 / LARS 414 / MAFF 240422) TaxID=1213857 RepID=A0A484FDM7_COLOR|nr:hypothetical protein Cob_v011525 [Colletotrichum orbiculare MAFF 240422]